MSDGVLILNKPDGMTSYDAVAKIKKLYGTGKVGHTGTLDPMATGVLCILIGRAVKASEYAVSSGKSYRAGLLLGQATDTGDITGRVTGKTDILPSEEEVKEAVSGFRGEIMQVPPMYSALKVGGRKLCDLARQGITVSREARPVFIENISCTPVCPGEGRYILDVSCSRGTYIRTLCEDIGKALGNFGTMYSLIRTSLGKFTVEESHTFSQLENMTEEEREGLLIPTEELFSDLPEVRLPQFFAKLALAGNEIYLKKIGLSFAVGQRVRMYDSSFFSLGEVMDFPDGPAIKPIKKFRL